MDSSDDNSDSELFLTAAGGYEFPPVPEHSQLKPKLDSIFAEVEKNLPSIDFDLSDVSSDNEDQEIFHRSLFNTSLFDDDKDLDTSQCGDTFSGLSQPNIDSVSLTNVRVDVDTQAVEIQGNVAAAAIGHPERPRAQAKSTSWTEVVIESHEEKDKFKERKTASNNATKTSTGTQMDEDLSPMAGAMSVMEQELDNEDKYRPNSTEEELEKHEKESTSETASKVSSASSSGVGTYNSGDKRMNKLVTTEEIRRNEKKLVSNMVPTSAPKLLSNNLNIDLILCSLDEEHRMNSSVPPVVREAWARQQRIQSLIGAGEGSNRFLNEHKEEENTPSQTLIQRLAEFSMTQSGEDMTDIDPLTGAQTPRDTDADVIETDNRSKSPLFTRRKPPPEEQKEKKTTSTSCGTNTNNNDGPLRIITPTPKNKLEAEKNPESKRERETVFIDLRNHDQKVKEQQQIISRVQQVLHISHESESSSDSDSEDDMQTWFEQRRRLKQTLATRGVNADALPNKPKPKSAEPFKHPNRVINLSELDNRLVAKIKPETTDEELSEEQKAALEKERKIKEEERERQRKIEEARKQREEREAERQSRLRLAKRLEVLRPTASVSGKQDCAETTPVMFDLEASYEPSPSTLPPFLPSDKEILLLTIHLSSNGEIILHRGKSKSVDTGLGLSASYTVLLTWLLSMVPENYDFLIKKPEELEQVPFYPPFYVLGMQQLLMDEDLCLVVAVTPHPLCDTKGIPNKQKKSKTKLKDEVKNNSPFQQFLTKFLSTNTLHTVCPWLQAVVPIDISCPSQDPEDTATYVYRAPLPIITTKPLSTFIQMNPDPQAAQKVFNTPVGFFWQTVDNEESSFDHGLGDSEVNYDTQLTMSLVYKKIFQEPPAMSGIFNKIMQEGLDLSGVRLLYPVQELLDKPSVPNQSNRVQSNIEFLNKVGPVLALGLRGTFARAIWLDAVGPTDPALARRTDPNSLCALFGGASRDECLLFSPRNPSRVHSELTRWFAGRVPPGGVIDVGTPYTRKDHLRSGSPKSQKAKKTTSIGELTEERPASGQSKKSSSHHSLMDSHTQHRPPAALTTTTTSEIILVISPVVRPQYIGIIMASCQRKGFRIRGVRRQKLTTKKVASLGIDSSLLRAFCPGISDDGVPSQASKHAEATSPCFLLLLEKENAAHNAASLIESCMIQLTLKGLMENMQSTVDHYLESKHMFYSARYSDNLLVNVGGDFSKCVDHEIQVNPNFVVPKLYTNPEMEQIVILILLGHEIQKNSGMFVGKLLGMIPFGKLTTVVPLKEGFELLGMKWLPGLTTSQAKEVTPCEVGDRLWKDNIHTLVSEPALVLALRGIDAFRRLEAVVPLAQPGRGKDSHIDYIMSRNAEESYGFARAFFTDKEIFSDPTARHLLMYLPQVRHHIQGFGSRSHSIKTDVMTESMFDVMLSGPQPISTLLVIKPRAVKKHLTKILRKVMLEGFTVVGLRLGVVSQEEELVCLIDEDGELDSDRLDQHKKYLSSGPSLILALERENAVKKLLDLLGPCDPLSARRQSQFLWRGTFGMDTVANGLHGSQNFPHAVQELKLFFKDGLCCNETDELRDLEIIGPAIDSLLDMTKGDKRIVQITNMQGDTDHSAIEQTKSPPTLRRTYSKINPFEFKEDAVCDELTNLTTQKKVNKEVYRPSTSECSEMGDASPLSAEPVGVYDDDMSGMTEDESNMSKKSRTDIPKEALVETIQKKLKGYMVLPVSKLRQPSFGNLLREPDIKHVKELEREFSERPGNYFQLMVVNVCGEMKEDNFESCTLEVIGGNHSREALQNIISTTADPTPFEKRMCIVYTNLNPDEAKYVANQHNQVRKFGTDLDLVDRASCFRYSLFEKAGYTHVQDTTTKATPTGRDMITEWKEGLQLAMGSVSRKTLNNRFRLEMRFAQLSSEVWIKFLDFVNKLKMEIKKDKISGRLLKPLDGVQEKSLLKFLKNYNSGKINFKQLVSLCTEFKCSDSNKKECELGTSEVEAIAEPSEDKADKEDAIDYSILIEALKETADREKRSNDDLKLKNAELKEALEASNREKNEIKQDLAQRFQVEKNMRNEICQLKEKLNQVTKECRIMREKQDKLIKRKITTCTEIQLLLQTTCIVLKPPLLKIHDRGHYAYVEIVEELLKQEFEIVGARMVWFTQEQAEVFLHIINAGSYKQVPMLLAGPSLVFALQRDNAVLSFDSILGSDFGADSIIGKYGGGIFRPADIKQAHRMLGFFFDDLMPGSQIKITPKDESVSS